MLHARRCRSNALEGVELESQNVHLPVDNKSKYFSPDITSKRIIY